MKKLVIVLFSIIPCFIMAEDSLKTSVDVGYGNDGSLISLEVGYEINQFLLSIETMYNFEQILVTKIPVENKWENNLFIGYKFYQDDLVLEVKTGIGIELFKQRKGEFIKGVNALTAEYDYTSEAVWGLPVELLLMYRLNEKLYFGLGIESFITTTYQRYGVFFPLSLSF